MSLRIIYGRAGSGKTSSCLKLIDKIINEEDANILYIVPEQFSLQTEKKIVDNFGSTENRVDVLSFERLSQRVFSQVGPIYSEYIDDTGKQILMQRALIMLKNKLTVLSGASETEGFGKVLVDTVNEPKRHNVTPSMLYSSIDSINGSLKLKLADIAMIYEEYEKQFSHPSADEEDNLSVLRDKIIKHNLFYNTHIIIDSFNNFSLKQLSVIEEFMSRSLSVTVTLTTDSLLPSANIADIFYNAKKTANKLFDLAVKNNTKTLPNVYTGDCKKYNENPELCFLEKNYFKYPAEVYKERTKNISIFKANNYYGEIEATAVNIIRLCREENYRFRDIAVITKGMDTYAPLIRHIFSEYEILYHIDEKLTAIKHSFSKAVLSIFEIIIYNFKAESLLGWIKSDYSGICKEDSYILENYILACGNTQRMWQRPDDWTFKPSGYSDSDLSKINRIKNIARTPIINFAEKFKGRKTVTEISSAFADFLYECEADKIIQSKYKYYMDEGYIQKGNAQTAVWNAVMSTVDRMVSAIGDMYITFEKYYSILKSALQGFEIGQIPPTVDEVQVCSVDRFKNQDVKCVFIIGTTNGVFPACYTNEGLLSDSDRSEMSNHNIELADDTVIKQSGENYVIYLAVTSALEKLYFSYPVADNDGGALYQSTIIERIKDIFPYVSTDDNIYENDSKLYSFEGATPTFNKMILDRHKYKEVEAWFKKNQPKRLSNAMKALSYTNIPQKLSSDAVSLLYSNIPKGSVSRAELYNKCQYAYFLKYGLNTKERQVYNIEPADAGTFMHEIIETYSKFASEFGWSHITKSICEAKTDEITEAVLQKYLSEAYTSSSRLSYLSKKTRRIMSATAWSITEFYNKSSFVPLGYEISFDYDGNFPPIEVDIGDAKVMLRGKVDRADIWRTENGNYISIVDYKSSSKNIDFSEILCGIQVQLPTYIKAVCDSLTKKESVKTMPAAMLYYKFDAPVISAKRNISDEEIRENVQKALRMQGLTLESEKISDNIGSVFAVKSVATSEQIDRLCKTAYKQLKKAFSGILSGNIDINPLRVSGKTSCDWCPYGSVCRFDTSFSDNKYRNIKKFDREEFFNYVGQMD